MSRVVVDANLLKWEAYVSSGKHGYADRPRIVFHCLSDRARRARFIDMAGDQSDAEREVASASDERLLELLGRAAEID